MSRLRHYTSGKVIPVDKSLCIQLIVSTSHGSSYLRNLMLCSEKLKSSKGRTRVVSTETS